MIPQSRRVMNLAHLLRQAARRFGGDIGFVHADATWTWAAMDAEVNALAAGLADLGIRKGDRVLVQSRNCVEMFCSMFACFRLGAVWVPTNFRQTPSEVAYLAAASGAVAMLCQPEFAGHPPAARAASAALRHVIWIGDGYTDLIARHRGARPPVADVEHDDPCWFFFTSGTTNQDASLVVAPLSHGAGIHQLVQVARAAKTVLAGGERFDPAEAWALVAQWRITNMFTVPTILKMLVEHPAVDRFDHSSLRHVIYAGAPMYRADQKFALAKLGPVLVQYFGLGEVTGNITVLPPYLHHIEDGPAARIGTCGVERTAMQVSIQNDSGAELPPGETGEICVCGPAVFAGYFDNPEANAKAFRNGWFRTGDLGHMDAEGFLFITGRASDMYISGGSNIYPREIEEVALEHPAIAEVAIVGMPDPTWGEVGIMVCVTRAAIDEATLVAFLAPRIARYKLPRKVVFWESLPKSAYGKVPKALIRAALLERGDWSV